MDLIHKPELLAPAGTLQTVEAVLNAGADAVYCGGKRLNMRMHRSSYNLSDDDLAGAIDLAHRRGRKLYLTLNNLILEEDLDALRSALELAARLRPDALIVQDLATVELAREICVEVPLHASTMMNVHSEKTAAALKLMGFVRAIASRDIPLHEARRIAETSGLEMEYFVHGDMCIAHSSQCYLSSLVFGESSNRGRCVKPCRWDWKLLTAAGSPVAGMSEGYLLARRDLCMFQHIPELVQNRIASLKIEGRMRTADFLAPLVAAYRQAIDGYFSDPLHYATQAEGMDNLWLRRVREFTTALCLRRGGAESVDASGKREPRLFSLARAEADLSEPPGEALVPPPIRGSFELAVHVATRAAAESALAAGANAVYLGGDEFPAFPGDIDPAWLREFCSQAAARRARVAVLSTRTGDERDLAQWAWWLKQVSGIRGLGAGASTIGAIEVARSLRVREILGDYSLNLANSLAADALSTLGATRVTASVELDFACLRALAAQVRLPLEAIVHGPLPGMLLEHCVVAAAAGQTSHEPCAMSCRKEAYVLRDTAGQDHAVRFDSRCRNHLYAARELCLLPSLGRLAPLGLAAVRIEAQFYTPAQVELVVGAYRRTIDQLRAGHWPDVQADLESIAAATGLPLGDGPMDFSACESQVFPPPSPAQAAGIPTAPSPPEPEGKP